jgi:pimeloyl-ACP methyl ester carboxylesterase
VRSLLKLVLYLSVPALLLNWWVVSRTERAAEPFAGGKVIELVGPDLNVRQYRAADRPEGPTGAIVLLHGYAGSIQWWDDVAQRLADRTHREVVAIDLVGHGGSESPRDSRAYGAVGQALAVRRAMAALHVDDAVLVGHSMGGQVATLVAEQEPDRVERVAVIDTFGAAGLYDLGPLQNAACWPVIGAAIDRLRAFDVVTKSSLERAFADGFAVPDFAYDSVKRMTQRGTCQSNAGDQMNRQRPTAQRLASLGKPVLVIWGARDVLTPMAANAAAYRDAGINPTVIQAAGHSGQVETPGKVVKILTEFLP